MTKKSELTKTNGEPALATSIGVQILFVKKLSILVASFTVVNGIKLDPF